MKPSPVERLLLLCVIAVPLLYFASVFTSILNLIGRIALSLSGVP